MKAVEQLLKGELIGRNTVATSLKDNVAFEGKIIDETKNMVVLKTKLGRKNLVKQTYAFEFKIGKQSVKIEGRHFAKRPHDRIKKSPI